MVRFLCFIVILYTAYLIGAAVFATLAAAGAWWIVSFIAGLAVFNVAASIGSWLHGKFFDLFEKKPEAAPTPA